MLRLRARRWGRRSAAEPFGQTPGPLHPRHGLTDGPTSEPIAVGTARTPPPADDPADHDAPVSPRFGTELPQVLKLVSTVIAPTTLVTALAIYFGRMHATGYFQFFDVNYTVFDMTVQDYLVRAADGLFVPMVATAASVLLAVWIHRLLTGALLPRTRARVVRWLLPLVAASGLLLLYQALNPQRHEWPVYNRHPELGGLSLSVGVVLLVYAAHLIRLLPGAAHEGQRSPTLGGGSVAEWAAAFILISAGLFWAVNTYAQGVGWGRGEEQARGLTTSRDVVVYSQQPLNINAAGVSAVVCENPEPGYRYRYDGLKVGLKLGGQYFFLPATWTRAEGAALVIPSNDTLRLEFTRPGRPTFAC